MFIAPSRYVPGGKANGAAFHNCREGFAQIYVDRYRREREGGRDRERARERERWSVCERERQRKRERD
jgi:hypothetical protein